MTREENPNRHLLDLVTTKVVVGDKTYAADHIDLIQTPFDFPKVRVEATVDPFKVSPIQHANYPSIKKVIFNPPATIVFWSDNTKTVIKCDPQQDVYDPEKGIAMAVSKKFLGDNKYEYYNIFKHWLKKWDKQTAINTEKNEWKWTGDMSDAF